MAPRPARPGHSRPARVLPAVSALVAAGAALLAPAAGAGFLGPAAGAALAAPPAAAAPPVTVGAGSVATADARLAAARRALEVVDESLAQATADLGRLGTALGAAEEEHRAAERALAAADARLVTFDRRLDVLVAERDRARGALADRAAELYKRGGGAQTGAMLAGLLSARDLHDLSVGARVVAADLEQHEEVTVRSRALTVATAGARRGLAAGRSAAADRERRAEETRAAVEELTRRKAEAVVDATRERRRRLAIVAEVEADREQAAALAARLNAAVTRLAAQPLPPPAGGPVPDWAGRLPVRGRPWAAAIAAAAAQAGIDPRLLAALVWSESGFRPTAVSSAGAVGLAQLMPATAVSLGVDPHDPLDNLAGGAAYLAAQIATFGSVELALAAYNAGPGAVARHGGIPPYTETRLYVLTVVERYEALAGR